MSYARMVQRTLAVAGTPALGIAYLSTTTFCEKQASTCSTRLVTQATNKLLSTATTGPVHMTTKIHPVPARRGFSSTSSSSSTTANTATAKAASGGFLPWYEGHLQARPVFTKMVTGMCLWSIGDAVAQVVPQMVAPAPTHDTTAAAKPFVYDWPRTGRAALFGFALHAPTSHVHFNFLEWLTHRVGVTGLGIPVFKAFMEQFVYWSWISNSMYHGAMGAMQGQNLTQIYNRIADVLWETQKAQWVFWIPIQLLNFQFVPVRHQLNVVLLTSIVWTALLSAWYPPMPEEKKIDEEVAKK